MLDLIVDALAAWRLTHLVVEDELTAPLRDWVSERWPERKPAYLIRCPWCVGIWAGLTVAALSGSRPGRWLCRALAVGGCAPVIEAAVGLLDA